MATATDGPHVSRADRAAARVRRIAAATIGVAALVGATCGVAYAADSLSLQTSPGAKAGAPVTVRATGSTSAPSTLRVFVQEGGAGCASGDSGAGSPSAADGAEQESRRTGATEVVSATPNGQFSESGQFTPARAGTYRLCAYLFRSSGGSSVSSQVSKTFGVAEADPPSDTGAAPGSEPSGAPTPLAGAKTRCVVPRLRRHSYAYARKLIRRGGCRVGKVSRPSHRSERRSGRPRRLVVICQRPRPKAVRKLNTRVNVRLGTAGYRHRRPCS